MSFAITPESNERKGAFMKRKWWHDKVAYQIYPKSFLDTNGDGIGDLKGIISKLDYLKELGIDIIWLSPVYESPFVDQGYDISDYYKIAEQFGTMDDFDTLVAEMKKRGMHLIMDLVVNHCSDKHEWFQKALADPDGPYAGYFYFREGKDGKAPSNYRSYFGGSAWTKVPGTNKYYLHTFAKEQPDLNWENPVVRKKIYEMINWWFEKGISGFRIDAIINIKKNLDFPSFPADGDDGLVSCDKMLASAHGIGTFLEEMKHETFDKYDAFTVGEVFHLKEDELREFIGEDGHFSTKFDFSAHVLSYGEHGWYDAPALDFNRWRTALFDTQKADLTVGFEANIIENHDEPRGATHYLPAHARNEAGVKMLAATYFLLRGIPFIYQGQEIGMTNCVRNDISEYDDISTKDQYQAALNAGCSKEAALHACYENSRDNARTPMQWGNSLHGGFTTGTPWLAENPNYTKINVTDQMNRSDSVLSFYKELIALRKAPEYVETFTYGTFAAAYEDVDHMFAYYRTNEETGQRILIAGNFGTDTVTLPLKKQADRVLLTNGKTADVILTRNRESASLVLGSCDCVVLLL